MRLRRWLAAALALCVSATLWELLAVPLSGSALERASRLQPLSPHDEAILSSRLKVSPNAHGGSRKFVLATAGSRAYYDRLLNLLGSVAYWEPHLTKVVYDLGLSEWQRRSLHCMKGVLVRDVDFAKLPVHTRRLGNFAWKAVVLQAALDEFGAVFYEDSGQELRAPLDEIAESLDRDGHFCTVQDTRIVSSTADAVFAFLGLEKSRLGLQHQRAGGIQGFVRNSTAVHKVLEPTLDCSLKRDCIDPPRLSREQRALHRWDQSIFSIYYALSGLRCRTETRFHASWKHNLQSDIVLMSRRYRCPKPYLSSILKNETCNMELLPQKPFVRPYEDRTAEAACGGITYHGRDFTPEGIARLLFLSLPLSLLIIFLLLRATRCVLRTARTAIWRPR